MSRRRSQLYVKLRRKSWLCFFMASFVLFTLYPMNLTSVLESTLRKSRPMQQTIDTQTEAAVFLAKDRKFILQDKLLEEMHKRSGVFSPVKRRRRENPCPVVRRVDVLGTTVVLNKPPLHHWIQQRVARAGGHFCQYGFEMALLYDVIVDPRRRHPGNQKGGEELKGVLGQAEDTEFLNLTKGFFRLLCVSRPRAIFKRGTKNHLNTWIAITTCYSNSSSDLHLPAESGVTSDVIDVSGMTLALQRYEYANMFFVILSLYNAFLASLTWNIHPSNTTLLIMDAHPRSGLDEIYHTLFSRVLRAGRLSGPTRFSRLGWIPLTYNSPARNATAKQVFYLEEFRRFVLKGHGVASDRSLNCSSMTYLFIWRRDYVAHPRNQKGLIGRKILNEEELITELAKVVAPGDRVEGHQMDSLLLKVQLQKVADADVLLGMHGAGMSHAFFLPPHAAVLEFFPFRLTLRSTFKAVTRWRGLKYMYWRNIRKENDRPDTNHTYIPPTDVIGLLKRLRHRMCAQ